jgi:hypothetical protein
MGALSYWAAVGVEGFMAATVSTCPTSQLFLRRIRKTDGQLIPKKGQRFRKLADLATRDDKFPNDVGEGVPQQMSGRKNRPRGTNLSKWCCAAETSRFVDVTSKTDGKC